MNTINKIIVMILVIIIHGCPKVDHFMIENTSNYKVYVFEGIRVSSSEILYSGNSYINPNSIGNFVTVNESVEMYFERNKEIVLFIVEYFPSEEFENIMSNKSYIILGKMLLSKSKLDSLGGKVIFPKDFELVNYKE